MKKGGGGGRGLRHLVHHGRAAALPTHGRHTRGAADTAARGKRPPRRRTDIRTRTARCFRGGGFGGRILCVGGKGLLQQQSLRDDG